MRFDISEQDNRNLSDDDENMTKGVDSFWGLEKAQPKEQKPHTASLLVEEKDSAEKNMTDVPAPANKEKSVIRSEKNYNTKTDKNNKEYLQKIWDALLCSIKNTPCSVYLQYAAPFNLKNGVFHISVPTAFAQNALKSHKQELLEKLADIDNTITGIRISASLNVNYFVRVHNRIISDETITNGAFRVYCALLTYRVNTTNQCKASVRQIASENGLSVNTVQSSLKLLKEEGYIVCVNKNYRFPLLEETEKERK